MKLSSDQLRFESAHSGLIFREQLYSRQQDALLVRDVLSLANADVPDPRWLVFGVGDQESGDRRFPGVDRDELKTFGKRLLALVARVIEPRLTIRLSGAKLDEAILAIVTLTDCSDQPYLVREPVGPLLPGTGFVRRGTATASLRRRDLHDLFLRAADAGADVPVPGTRADEGPDVRLFFARAPESTGIVLPVLPIGELPSARAARQIRTMLAAREQSRDAFGRTETALNRLVHARVYGADTPFEDRSDATLVDRLSRSVEEYAGADDWHRFETRAHRLELFVENRRPGALREAKMSLTIRLPTGTGISGGIYREDGTIATGDGYPVVEHEDATTIRIERRFDILPAGASLRAFREAPRLWARESADGGTVSIDYRIEAPGLDDAQTGSLTVRFVGAEPARAGEA